MIRVALVNNKKNIALFKACFSLADASTSASKMIKTFSSSRACAYVCVCAATSENEIPLRHNTSTRTFTKRGCVWPLKTLDPGLCVCLGRISFSLGSFLLFAFVLAYVLVIVFASQVTPRTPVTPWSDYI